MDEQTLDQMKESLEENGYAIIPNVLDEKECTAAIDGIWEWLEGIGVGIRRDDPQTWKSDVWPKHIHGIITYPSIGHIKSIWDVRAHPNVHKVYSKIWDTEKLLVSFDRACVMKPPELTGRWNKQKNWYHTDQTLRNNNKICVQGLITLEDMGSDDGTLMLLKGSHNYHKVLADAYRKMYPGWETSQENWCTMDDEHIDWYLSHEDVEEVVINAPKGSMVVWDSRVIHQNKWPTKGRKYPRWRYVVYSCMLPAEHIPVKDKLEREKALQDLRMTAHWPYPVTVFSDLPRTWGKELPSYKHVTALPDLTPLARKLAGLDPWLLDPVTSELSRSGNP